MTKYDYSISEVVHDPKSLEEQLRDLGCNGWEVVLILEKPSSGTAVKLTGWLIISKKVSNSQTNPNEEECQLERGRSPSLKSFPPLL